jgi:hypothetical protein
MLNPPKIEQILPKIHQNTCSKLIMCFGEFWQGLFIFWAWDWDFFLKYIGNLLFGAIATKRASCASHLRGHHFFKEA